MAENVELRFQLPKKKSTSTGVLDLLNGIKAESNATKQNAATFAREAAKGDPKAQYELARALTLMPKVSAEDNRRAVKWLKKAAEQHHFESEHLLGILIARGQGVRADPIKAVELFRSAAIMGYAPAEYDLARALQWGYGCEANDKEALTWFRLAAAQGHKESQLECARAYEQGLGCAINFREAGQYYRKAATLGSAEAAYRMSKLLSREDNPQADERDATRWLENAARENFLQAQFELAKKHFDNGDSVRALTWAKKAADGKHCKATLLLAKLLHSSLETSEKDTIKALAITLRAKLLGQIVRDTTTHVEAETLEKDLRKKLSELDQIFATRLTQSEKTPTQILTTSLERRLKVKNL